jgi:site-specific DNA recombinase
MSIRLNAPKNGDRYRALSYQRVSRDSEETGSHTFETQSQRIRERLDDICGRGGYDLVELADDGVSGGYGPEPTGIERRTRPTLKKLVNELKTGRYDLLIVYSFSRLVRSPRWFHQLLEDAIQPTQTHLVSVTEPYDLGSPDGRMMAGIKAEFDGWTRNSVIERNRDAALTCAQRGYYLGQIGYGWEWVPLAEVPERGRRGIRRVPEEGTWVVRIKDWYLAGWSLQKIAAKLNELGVPSPSGQKKWIAVVVDHVRKNPVHAGLVPSRNGPLPGAHAEQRYYEPEVFEQMEAACKERRRWAKTNTAKPSNHLLNGLIFCGRCGKRLYIGGNSKRQMYQCLNGASSGKLTCPGALAREDLVDAAVVPEIARLAKEPTMREILLDAAEAAASEKDAELCSEAEQLRKALGSNQERRDNLLDALMRKVVTDERYAEGEARLRTEQREVRERLLEIERDLENRQQKEAWVATLQETILQLPQVWTHLNMEERRSALSQVLEHLSLDRQGRTVHIRMKLHLLPERELTIALPPRTRPKRSREGVASLTPRQLVVLHYLGQGKSERETAELMGVSTCTVRIFISQIRKRLGIWDMKEAAELARWRIQSKLGSLPVGHFSSRQFAEGPAPRLSADLMEVFVHFASGAKVKEVVRVTGLSKTTVEGRRNLILDAFHTNSMYEAVQKAKAAGIL